MQNRVIGREEFEKIAGDLSEAQAAVRSAIAARATAKLNLDFTEVRAPIDGQISRALVTVGNLVESGETGGTALTTLVSVDPMFVYFDVDDLTYLQIKKLLGEALRKSRAGTPSGVVAVSSEGRPRGGPGLRERLSSHRDDRLRR